jgi:glycosyltransferase involved in cell wall biosynthesis
MNKKKILAIVHLYPPQHLCGGEMYIHRLLKFLQSKGHETRVLLMNAEHYGIDKIYVYDNVEVYPNNRDVIKNCCDWADWYITHLDYTETAISLGNIFRKPVIHLVHNDYCRPSIKNADRPQFVVYNSEWVRDKIQYPQESTVLHPPVDYRVYDTEINPSKNEYITLINLDHNKGGHILQQIAQRMPGRKFIAVLGSYSEPATIGQHTNQPPNVKVLQKTTRIKEIYAQTRILIMPSKYESWGMVATEAAASGIPVICTDTPGLKENLGKAGIYIKDRDDIDAWINAIHQLDKPNAYTQKSAAVKKRSRELDPLVEMEALHEWLLQHVRFNSQSKAAAVSTAANI